MKLDSAVITTLRPAILQVWETIGSDLAQCCEEAGERLCNEGAIESCIDAGRLEMDARDKAVGKAADTLVTDLCKEHGYSKVIKFLCKNISLV